MDFSIILAIISIVIVLIMVLLILIIEIKLQYEIYKINHQNFHERKK